MVKPQRPLPIEDMRAFLHYDPLTGTITNLMARRGARAGDSAGRDNGSGYKKLRFQGANYYNHRVAWAIYYNEQPPTEIDHVDGNGLNNSIANLRASSHVQNIANQKRRSDNSTGFKGVCLFKRTGKFKATIAQRHIGYFDTAEEAHAAYLKEAEALYGNFARAA